MTDGNQTICGDSIRVVHPLFQAEAGNETFEAAARGSIRWFEDWSNDTMRRIEQIPGAE